MFLALPVDRDDAKFRVVGRPVPALSRALPRAEARAALDLPLDEPCVLVFGGSLGARSINEASITGLAGAPYRVLHAAGVRDMPSLQPRVPAERYDLRPYIEDFGQALLAADLVVARSGGSVAEIASHGRPAVLVPYPHATADHQTSNARWMTDAGAAVVVPDAELTPQRLRAVVDELLGDPARLAAMAAASASIARPGAAAAVAGQVLAAAGRS
jgi:UDP-N-acetylglucosamine--N-acetylmuramyl-(pentapeptide) pyrophosphoryl-undecaprenol N-acetylglucosamine transferase